MSQLSSRIGFFLALLPIAAGAWADDTTAADDLSRMSLEQLAKVEVTSVSKSPEPLRRAPANVYVITHEDIFRSGATNISEVLRLAPNLQATQLTSSGYQFGAGGFGGQQESPEPERRASSRQQSHPQPVRAARSWSSTTTAMPPNPSPSCSKCSATRC
jgi:hypothetical protein